MGTFEFFIIFLLTIVLAIYLLYNILPGLAGAGLFTGILV